MRKNNEETTIKDLFGLFLPKVWIILLVAVILGGALGAYSQFLTKDKYTSSMTLYAFTDSGNTVNDYAVAQSMIKTYYQVFISDNFVAEIQEYLGWDEETGIGLSAEKIKRSIAVSMVDQSQIFMVNITCDTADEAYKIASAIYYLAGDLNLLSTYIPNSILVSQIQDPKKPEKPNGKNVLTNTILGFGGGAAISILIIWIAAMFDITVHDRKKLEENFDIPILGVIPHQDIQRQQTSEEAGDEN